jgi:hypothetical protein
MRMEESIAKLNAEITAPFNSRGQRGNSRINAQESELIDFNRSYTIAPYVTRQSEVFVTQERICIEENEPWQHVSERIATVFRMPRWSLFRLYPVDNSNSNLGRSKCFRLLVLGAFGRFCFVALIKYLRTEPESRENPIEFVHKQEQGKNQVNEHQVGIRYLRTKSELRRNPIES